jgi:glutaredoxin
VILQLIRWPLGRLILLVDALTAPRRPEREPLDQARFDQAMQGLVLYQYEACPFCVKARRALRRLGLTIELRDVRSSADWRDQLITEGGRLQVPCLYIPGASGPAQWLYESDDIIAYLERRCASLEAAQAA